MVLTDEREAENTFDTMIVLFPRRWEEEEDDIEAKKEGSKKWKWETKLQFIEWQSFERGGKRVSGIIIDEGRKEEASSLITNLWQKRVIW